MDRSLTRVARKAGRALVSARLPGAGSFAFRLGGRLVHAPRFKAGLLRSAVETEIEAGREPRGLVAAYAAELDRADRLYARAKPARAAAALMRSTSLAFHRAAHRDRLSSPLAADPAGFLAPLHGSRVATAVRAPRGRTGEARAATTGPLRLLILTRGNANFLPVIESHYAAHPEVEVRRLDLSADPITHSLAARPQPMMESALGGGPRFRRRVQEKLGPHLDWADVAFVDWCDAAAAMVSLIDPGSTRIIVRLHSYELLTRWPHLVDFTRVDDLVFVADHVRDLAEAVLPGIGRGGPRLHVIPNAMDLASCRRGGKGAAARFALGLVGMGQVAKDPSWAVEVLRILRAHDTRYRLLIAGGAPYREASPASRRYYDQFDDELAGLEAGGAVRRLGHVADVPAVLAGVGVILSTSVRESFHCGLIEGAASEAVPVVRDWPFFAGKPNGARTVFPADWIVESPDEAAARILAATASEAVWRETARAAAGHAIGTWDWSVVRHEFDRLLFGIGAPATPVAGTLAG